MVPTNKPQNTLNGIEYLLLSMQSHPGKSQRWHLRRLHMYNHGRPDYHKGGTNCGYFTSPSYRNILWHDFAVKDVVYPCFNPVERPLYGVGPYKSLRSKCAQMYLTMRGWERANQARVKIGLESIIPSYKDKDMM